MPNGEEYREGIDNDSEDRDNEYAEDSENETEDSSSSDEEVDSPPHSKH